MKTKLRMPAAISILLVSLITVAGQAINPATGLPVANRQPGSPAPAVTMFDPTTGQPIAQPAPAPDADWKDPDWKDPDITLADVHFPGISIREIASIMSSRFKDQFDIILPAATAGPGNFNRLTGMPVADTDWTGGTGLELHLKNVTASEIFRAMNLVFENDKTPLKWELKINGHRQLALLRVLVDQNPSYAPPPPQPARQIYYVGDLIGDEKDGGMSMEQIIKTITDVWQMTDTSNGRIEFHKDAQLVIVSGTPSQVDFVQQTLVGLRDRRRHMQETAKSDDPKVSPAITK